MDFSGRVILSFIEEDNTVRAYFRVRPLLTEEGALPQSEIDQLPDDGYLRVVPDRNEQHTFKERMRGLEPMCVIDLKNLPPDAVKIRSNKNYAPQQGENNQFIIYSDAVREIPQQLFFEVISAEADEKEKISQAATPQCYLRSGGRIYGPVSRATGLELEGAAQLAPDSEGIFAVNMPDGTEKLFYWPQHATSIRSDKAEGAQKDPSEAGGEEQQLNGMPLYQTMARRPATPQRAHNPLMDVVDRQLHGPRPEAPGASLNGGETKLLDNPLDAFKHALNALWTNPDMQQQAAAHFLSMTGVQSMLDKQLATRGTDVIAAALNGQVQDLEAERLALIMQVEAAQKNMSALRSEALAHANKEETEALERARQATEAAKADLEQMQIARGKLLEERDEALAEMRAAAKDTVYLAAQAGGYADLENMVDRITVSLTAAGAACSRNDALHLLTLLCVAPKQIEIEGATIADSLANARAVANALGVTPCYDDGTRSVCFEKGGDSFCVLIAHDGECECADYTRLIVNPYTAEERAQISDVAYTLKPWPVAYLKAADGWSFAKGKVFSPVNRETVKELMTRDAMEVPAPTYQLLEALQKALCEAGAPLPAQVRSSMNEYLSVAAGKMAGGIASALDYAVSAWVVPHAKHYGIRKDQIRLQLQGLPMAQALMRE